MLESLAILRHFARARWGYRFRSRAALEAWQQRRLRAFLRQAAERSPHYRDLPPALERFPVMGKESYLRHFQELNSAGIRLDRAEALALRAERERDFTPTLENGLTAGLSSGTSGRRGVFLVSPADRLRWAGIILARALSAGSLRHLLDPGKPPLRIAFLLRANSNLYQSVAGRRIDFRYYDLTRDLATLAEGITRFQPHILIAPATVLAALADHPGLDISPAQVISVAEVLDTRDGAKIRARFRVELEQIYQATEGFIAHTCPEGRLHLNEEFLHVEREWLEEEHGRFHPVITDFTRETQYFIRYRLDDILVADERPCPCGKVTRVIREIEGRADEVLRFPAPVFPDSIRQALYALPAPPDHYRLEQHGPVIRVFLKHATPALEAEVAAALERLFRNLGIEPPAIEHHPWSDPPPADKQRRIRRVHPIPHPAA